MKKDSKMTYDSLLCTGLNDAASQVHAAAKNKGFWDSERETGTLLMLCVSELSEALEADRKNRLADIDGFNNWMGEEEMMEGKIDEKLFKDVF
ncbi:MAG: hypothetical protein ACOWWH_12765, partial [Eubacteriaceae bacterium]